MNPFSGYIMGGLGVMLLLACLGDWFLFNQWEAAKANVLIEQGNVRTVQAQLDTANAAVAELRVQRATDQANMDALADQKRTLESAYADIKSKFDGYRSRIVDDIGKRPAAFERAAGLATRGVVLDFCQVTGGRCRDERSEGGEVPPGPAAAGVRLQPGQPGLH